MIALRPNAARRCAAGRFPYYGRRIIMLNFIVAWSIGMERFFQVLAAVLAAVAAYFLWAGNFDGVFLAGVAASVCFFLSIRFQIKQRLKERAESED